MRILIVNFSDIQGGAARAASRLHESLLKESIDSMMLVLHKGSEDHSIVGPKTKIQKIIAKSQSILNTLPVRKYERVAPFSASFSTSFNISKKINAFNPDIVHLHWINAGMLRIEDLKKIKAPIVWSLHDMWPFTGGCHYSNACEAYKVQCHTCPVLQSNKKDDLSNTIFLRKQKNYSKISNLTIIGLSKWLQSCAKNSLLFKDRNVVNLPNPINTKVFRQLDKEKAREYFGLPKDKKLVLFGAMSATSDNRKGFIELCDALKHLKSNNVELLVFGSNEPKESQNFKFKTHYLGHFNDSLSLVTLYNAADVMVTPSLQENLSNVIMESLSCATPVVAFNIGGNSDMIDHKKNGYLAAPFNTIDLAHGIDWIIENNNYNTICENAREKAVKNFANEIVAAKYIDLYNVILNTKNID